MCVHCSSPRGGTVPPSVAVFRDPRASPRSENPCLPPKMALIQIKLNEVTATNPCVFQILRQLPLANEWVKPTASGPSSCWPCAQAAQLPVPNGGNSRPLSNVTSHCATVCVCLCVCELRCSVNLCLLSSRPDSCCVYSPLLLSCLRVCLQDLSLFETSLRIPHIPSSRFFFANLHLNVPTQRGPRFSHLSPTASRC